MTCNGGLWMPVGTMTPYTARRWALRVGRHNHHHHGERWVATRDGQSARPTCRLVVVVACSERFPGHGAAGHRRNWDGTTGMDPGREVDGVLYTGGSRRARDLQSELRLTGRDKVASNTMRWAADLRLVFVSSVVVVSSWSRQRQLCASSRSARGSQTPAASQPEIVTLVLVAAERCRPSDVQAVQTRRDARPRTVPEVQQPAGAVVGRRHSETNGPHRATNREALVLWFCAQGEGRPCLADVYIGLWCSRS
ncbi:hypothetical protein IWZ00DRAFT_250142 [Phyllosticta capitalensis]